MNDSIIERIKRRWHPQPIAKPTVDPDLSKLNGLQRATEALRYSLLSLEWWLSPNGRLREWLKLNGQLGSILVIPAVLVEPLVTVILWQISRWTGWLVGITGHLILVGLTALVAVVVIAVLRLILGK